MEKEKSLSTVILVLSAMIGIALFLISLGISIAVASKITLAGLLITLGVGILACSIAFIVLVLKFT